MDPENQDSANHHTARVSISRQIVEKSVIQGVVTCITLNLHYFFFKKDGDGFVVPLALMSLAFSWLSNRLYEKFRGV